MIQGRAGVRYFVQQWIFTDQLPLLKLGTQQQRANTKKTPKIHTDEFLRENKYNPRYEIFWLFVTGLLDNNHNKEQLCRFFRTMEDQSSALVSPVHQRLTMYCLSEVGRPQEMLEWKQLRKDLEGQLKW